MLWFPHTTASDDSEISQHWSENFLLCWCQCGVTIWLGRQTLLKNIQNMSSASLRRWNPHWLDPDRFMNLFRLPAFSQSWSMCQISQFSHLSMLLVSTRLGFYKMRKDVPLNPASLRTGLIETEEVVVYKGVWPWILRSTEPSDSGALRQTAALMLPLNSSTDVRSRNKHPVL